MGGFEEDMDSHVNAAVERLADVLSFRIRAAIEDAAIQGLDRIEQGLQRRSRDIDTATQKVVEIISSLGDEMHRHACEALSDGVTRLVIPSVELQAKSVIEIVERRLIESFAQAEQRVATTVSSILRAQAGLRDFAQAQTDAVINNQESGQRELGAAINEATTRLAAEIAAGAAAIQDHVRAARAVAEKEAEGIRTAIGRSEQGVIGIVAATEARIAHRQEDHATVMIAKISGVNELATRTSAKLRGEIGGAFRTASVSTAAQSQSFERRVVELNSETRKSAEQQGLFLMRLWYCNIAIVILSVATLAAVLILRR